jgi:SNF2 family DNA or RNA helicase
MLARTQTYQPVLPRWEHQDNALAAINGAEAFALFMEMRTGKTKCILDEFGQDELNGKVRNLLVIAPAGVYRTWEDDANKHLSDDLAGRAQIGIWESGPSERKRQQLQAFLAYEGPRILLVNIEALSTVEEARDLCLEFLRAAPTTMVVDESTTIKGRDASRTKFCIKAARLALQRRILSGLPSPQSPLDLYTQFDFLQRGLLGFRRYSEFEAHFAILTPKPFGPGGRMINIITGYQNLDELHQLIQPHSFRVRLADCYELPEKMYLRRDVEMTAEQARLYREMVQFCTAKLEKEERVTATIVLTQMLRLHQIMAGHTMSDNGKMVDIAENKTKEILDILENVAGKAVIWAAYDADIKKISKALIKVYGAGSVARFWGGNANTREAEELVFKTDPQCRFMIATAAAGGRGRTWDVANTIIYHSNTFSLEHRMQSEERTQAIGKRVSVGVYDLITQGTIEGEIVNALRNKLKLSNVITGDNWKSWIQ